MTDEILKRVDALAAKLNTTAERLFAVLTRQARIDGIEYTIYAGVCFIVLIFCGVWLKKALREEEGDQMAGAILIGCVALAFMLIFADSAISGLVNPEFGAVQYLSRFLGGAK